MRSLLRPTVDLLFPPSCLCCGVSLGGNVDFQLCEACVARLVVFEGPVCRLCSAPVPKLPVQSDSCVRCARSRLQFDRTLAVGEYDGSLKRLVLETKEPTGEPMAHALASLLWNLRGKDLAGGDCPIDVVVPIASHWRRRLAKRTESTEILADVLATRARVPLAGQMLRRVRHTTRQVEVPPSERFKNVRRCFQMRRGYQLRGAHVLLVDDILTTGATCSEAARCLKASGADVVTVAVVARGLGTRY